MEYNKNTFVLPLFPLGVFILPGEKRILHIFEKRYRNLFADIQESDNLFGIPYVVNGKTMDIGTVARLEKVHKKYMTGEFDVIIRGDSFFNTIDFYSEHSRGLYPYGEVKSLELKNFHLSENVKKEFDIFCRDVLEINPDVYKINSLLGISTVLGLLDWEKYDLISEFDVSKINTRLLNLIRLKTDIANQENNIIEGFSLN